MSSKKVNYVVGVCPKCSQSKSGKNSHGRFLFECKLFGSIPAYRCGACGFVFRKNGDLKNGNNSKT